MENDYKYDEYDPKIILEFLRSKPQAILNLDYDKNHQEVFKPYISKVKNKNLSSKTKAQIILRAKGEDELLSSLKDSEPIVVLDHLQDTHNLGAIARSCAFFGVTKIVLPTKRQTLFSAGALAASRGGFAYVELYSVVNLSRALKKLKSKDYWIVGADMLSGEQSEFRQTEISELDLSPIALILGAEGSGLSQSIHKQCDHYVYIRAANKLDSLNVSVAAGICLREITRKK